MNIIIPMAGSGKRFLKAGYKNPKPLIDVNGKPMIERVIENLTPKRREHKFFFVVQADHFTEELRQILMRTKNYEIILLSSYTEGATESALKAMIDQKKPVLLASCDQLIDWKVDDFLDSVHGLDGALVTYKTDAPNHSFCRCENGKVVEVAEKEVISDQGNIGIYYFGNGLNFLNASKLMIYANDRFNGEFYNSKIYNHMIQMGNDNIENYEINPATAHVIGTPESLNDYTKTTSKAGR